jgi:hypothetical protein
MSQKAELDLPCGGRSTRTFQQVSIFSLTDEIPDLNFVRERI